VVPLETTAPPNIRAKERIKAKTFMTFSAVFIHLLEASEPESTDGGIF